jgi:signal transduction histidine kinase
MYTVAAKEATSPLIALLIQNPFMRKLLLLSGALLYFSSGGLLAQDTTEIRILSAKDDSAKIVQLFVYANGVEGRDDKKAFTLYEEVMRLGRKLNYPYWIGMAWFKFGYLLAKESRDLESIRNFDSAMVYLQKANSIERVANCHLNIAALAERLGDVNTKLKHLTATLQLLENTPYKKPLNRAYNSLGVLFFNQDNYEKGLYYFQRSEQSSRLVKDTASLVEALFGTVNCLSSLKKFNEARSVANDALRIATASGSAYDLVQAHTAFSEMYRKWQKADLTIEHAKKIVQYAIADNNVQYRLIGLMGLADGFALAGNYAKGISYYQQALQLGSETGTAIQLDDIYKGLSDSYAKTGQAQKALDFYKKYIEYRDSTANEKIKRNAAELDIKYQTAEKEKTLSQNQLQLTKKDLELQKSRNYMYYMLAAFVIAVMVVALLYLRMRYRKLVHAKELKTIQQEQELQLLNALMQGEEKERSRIAKDLHDGVAGMLAATKMHLSTIPSTMMNGQTQAFQQGMLLLDEATREIRKTSHNLMPEMLLANGLDEALRRYCANVSNEKLAIQYDSWGTIKRLKAGFELSVYRIVQELINNMTKHSNASQAIVQVSANQNILSLTIEDNGTGFDTSVPRKGMGIQSIDSRIRTMNGKMKIDSEPGEGVSVYLEFNTSGLDANVAGKI